MPWDEGCGDAAVPPRDGGRAAPRGALQQGQPVLASVSPSASFILRVTLNSSHIYLPSSCSHIAKGRRMDQVCSKMYLGDINSCLGAVISACKSK